MSDLEACGIDDAELKWLRELARHVPAFRSAVIAATKGLDLVPGTTQEYMRTAAKVDGALNEIRIARSGKK